ncbi:hypothetical protein N8Z10_00595 [bacterium]|nr:hypothetical protein [bacterium]
MEGIDEGTERDSLMRSSYYIITNNFTKTVNWFVVYKDNKNTIDIPHGIGQRSMFIDLLIGYFIELEEYEKCNKLSKLRELVIMAGD